MALPLTRKAASLLCLLSSILVLVLVAYLSYDAINPFANTFGWLKSSQQPPSKYTPSANGTTLIVSAFFPLSHSKHSMGAYKSWLTNFLEPLQTPIYMFTTPELAPILQALRGPNPYPLTINTTFSSPFDIPPLDGLQQKYEEMWAWDREHDRHGPELYAVWNGKPYFLAEGLDNAVREHGTQYEYAFWLDAGSFRERHTYVHWPDRARVRDVLESIKGVQAPGTKEEEELLFIPMWWTPDTKFRNWTEDMGPVDTEFSEGSFFGGTPASVTWWRNIYYTYHDKYLSNGIFVGKDQTLINALLLLFPRRFGTVWVHDVHPSPSSTNEMDLDGGRCGNTWYYFEWWLASREERDAMRRSWDSSAAMQRWWWKTLWFVLGRTEVLNERGLNFKERGCRLTDGLLVEDVLRREDVFGPEWRAPTRTAT
ncbi:hypothetical protein F5I97DRAFT_1893153 [Phlebopus sp. FC_14]|nr:hypothetical protein F5I97DRAFT_1893153 [Phlebopus sp. FC_14]